MEAEKHLGRDSNQAVKLLIIRDFLISDTNKDHFVNVNDIIEHLAEFGISAEKKAIYRDLKKIEYDYGLELETKARIGVRLKNPPFEPYELRLMVDAVQSSKFIPSKEANEITKKIANLTDKYTAKTLNRPSVVSERIEKMTDSVVKRTDTIYSAMEVDAKVSFKYVHFKPMLTVDENAKKTYSKNGEPYVVSPYALYWDNGNYYLYAYLSDKDEFRFFRIDRMEEIKTSSEQREGQLKYDEKNLRTKNKAKVFGMFSTGNVQKVQLRGINQMAEQVIDAFGSQRLIFAPDGEKYFTVVVDVDVSPTFFAWLCTYGSKLKIESPQSVVEEMKVFVSKLSEMYST